MNPYDFVPLDFSYKPVLRKPVWHNVLAPAATHPEKLYSGEILLDIKAETELFIGSSVSNTQNLIRPGEHIRNKAGQVIIPGSSLKGLLRYVVETLCRGCLTVYNDYRYPTPKGFGPCYDHTQLCVACRLFGMMERARNARIFLGKVNIEDAIAYKEALSFYDPIFTAVLDSPKPRHRAFYLKQKTENEIAGRKFYFHQDEIQTLHQLLEIKKKPEEIRVQPAREYRNQHIRPVKRGSYFSGRLTFRNLEADEFAALLLALTLRESYMRYKIGYGKPIGLGSIDIELSRLTLVDYHKRYVNFGEDSSRGITDWDEKQLYDLVGEQMNSIDSQISEAWLTFRDQPSLDHLRDIWSWPANTSVKYCYPSQRWFKKHPNERIADTWDLYPGD